MAKLFNLIYRHGYTSTNVLGVVVFDGRFLAVYPGCEGCASDGFMFARANNFLVGVSRGYYYLADAGFSLTKTILTPYRSTRYHLREWAEDRDGRPQNSKEIFNYRHSMARIIVEQAFGILKKKWGILKNSMEYELDIINQVIHCCCALHNYLLACRPSIIDEELEVENDYDEDIYEELAEQLLVDDTNVAADWRDNVAADMWNSYMMHMQEE